MQRLFSRSLALALAVLAMGAAACGPNPAGKVPVSSPVYSFQKPDAEDFDVETDTDDDTTPPDDADQGDGE